MAEAIGAVVAFAVGMAVSPIPVVAAIVVLFSERARVNGPLFALAWITGLTALSTVLYLIASALDLGTDAAADDTVSWVRIGLGLLLVIAAWRTWHHRPRAGDEPKVPGWMSRVEGFGPVQAFGLGVLLSLNPKSLALAVGAMTSLAQLDPTTVQAVAAVAAFVFISSTAVLAAVVYDQLGGARARATLEDAKSWLMTHHDAVMAVLFVVFGAVLISDGLSLRS